MSEVALAATSFAMSATISVARAGGKRRAAARALLRRQRCAYSACRADSRALQHQDDRAPALVRARLLPAPPRLAHVDLQPHAHPHEGYSHPGARPDLERASQRRAAARA